MHPTRPRRLATWASSSTPSMSSSASRALTIPRSPRGLFAAMIFDAPGRGHRQGSLLPLSAIAPLLFGAPGAVVAAQIDPVECQRRATGRVQHRGTASSCCRAASARSQRPQPVVGDVDDPCHAAAVERCRRRALARDGQVDERVISLAASRERDRPGRVHHRRRVLAGRGRGDRRRQRAGPPSAKACRRRRSCCAAGTSGPEKAGSRAKRAMLHPASLVGGCSVSALNSGYTPATSSRSSPRSWRLPVGAARLSFVLGLIGAEPLAAASAAS